MLVISASAYAQDDDMYYTPGKKSEYSKVKRSENYQRNITREDNTANDYTDAQIDAYNRRSTADTDTMYLGDGKVSKSRSRIEADNIEPYDDDYYYSGRLARFHEPAVNIYLGYGIPYWGVTYGFYTWEPWDPWYFDNWAWDYRWGWYPYSYGPYSYGWYPYSWYGGWYRPYYSGWYAGWWYHDRYRPYWGHGIHYGSSWNGGRRMYGDTHYSRIGSAGGRIWAGGRNYRDINEGKDNTLGGSRNYSPNSRGSIFSRGNSGRNAYPSSRPNTNIRSYGSTRSYSPGNMSTRSTTTQSSPSISSSGSRSFSGGISSPSMGTRSFGGGGGGSRSFGGGRR